MNSFLDRLVPILCLPLAFLMLLTGISPVTKTKQEALEAALEKEAEGDFEPVFRFAIASDVHISDVDPTDTERFIKMFDSAYAYADSHESYNSLDAVVLAGDNVESGKDEEYDVLNAVVDEKLREGTEFITIMGNHEFNVTGHEGYVRNTGEELDKHVVVKGFHFIGISPDPKDTWQTPAQVAWMSRELAKAAADDPDRPIFTMQHAHIWNTVYVSRSWYTQMSLPLHMVYSKYPQVVNFSGHSHGPINNPKDVWQNSYTQVGTGTMFFFEMEDDIGDSTIPEGARNAAQYLIVEVDADYRVRILPYNILTDDFMKTPATTDDPEKQLVYLIHDVKDTKNYAYTSARKKTASVPYFENGDVIGADEVTAESVRISFPQAEDDVCVYGYRIRFTDAKNPLKKVEKEIYSQYYFEPMPENLSVVIDGLSPNTAYDVTVTPLNVWLGQGRPLSTRVTTADK